MTRPAGLLETIVLNILLGLHLVFVLHNLHEASTDGLIILCKRNIGHVPYRSKYYVQMGRYARLQRESIVLNILMGLHLVLVLHKLHGASTDGLIISILCKRNIGHVPCTISEQVLRLNRKIRTTTKRYRRMKSCIADAWHDKKI